MRMDRRAGDAVLTAERAVAPLLLTFDVSWSDTSPMAAIKDEFGA